MQAQHMMADSVRHTRDLLKRYLVKFDDSNHTKSAPGAPNHLAWCLGHLALTNNRFTEWLPGNAGQALPEACFIEGSRSGDADRFGTESVCFGSDPNAAGVVFPGYARCVAIFEQSTERFAAAIERLTESEFTTPIPMFGGKPTAPFLLAARSIYHVGIHNGQIAYLRRGLGLGNVLG